MEKTDNHMTSQEQSTLFSLMRGGNINGDSLISARQSLAALAAAIRRTGLGTTVLRLWVLRAEKALDKGLAVPRLIPKMGLTLSYYEQEVRVLLAETVGNTTSRTSKETATRGLRPSKNVLSAQDIASLHFIQTPATGGRYMLSHPLLDKMMFLESRGRANARSPLSSAGGLFQFLDGTWNQYYPLYKKAGEKVGAGDKFNPDVSLEVWKLFLLDLVKTLERNGIPVSAANLYLAHQQGAGNFLKIFRAVQQGRNIAVPASRNEARSIGLRNPAVLNNNILRGYNVKDLSSWFSSWHNYMLS